MPCSGMEHPQIGAWMTMDSLWKRRIKMGTFIVGLLVFGTAAMVIRKMAKDKKNGKVTGCGGNCGKCGGHCR